MLVTVVSFLFVLGVLIIAHEFGHFLAAKRAGIRVVRFSIGFPPKIYGRRIGDTEYCISAIPFGGYVKMAGDEPGEGSGEPWEFMSKPGRIKAAVVAAGPAMNFLLAFLVFSVAVIATGVLTYETSKVGDVAEGSAAERAGILPGDEIISVDGREVRHWEELMDALGSSKEGPYLVRLRRGDEIKELYMEVGDEDIGISPFIPPRVGTVTKGSPAERLGLRKGDLIISVDGEPVGGWIELSEKIHSRPGREVTITWERDGRRYTGKVIPEGKEFFDSDGEKVTYGIIGIGPHYTFRKVNIAEAFVIGAVQTYRVTASTLGFLKGLIAGEVSPKLLGGPVFIAKVAGESARSGFGSLITFIAFLSVQLGLLNILPIPVLDGGHLLFFGIEGLIRHPLSPRQKAILQQIGMAILIFIMVYVTFNDITR